MIRSKNIYSVNFIIPNSAGSGTDISDEVVRTFIALTSPTNSLSDDNADVLSAMIDGVKANGSAYHKGLFIWYENRESAVVHRIGALTAEDYNQWKNSI